MAHRTHRGTVRLVSVRGRPLEIPLRDHAPPGHDPEISIADIIGLD
jgi:hypothetical protein